MKHAPKELQETDKYLGVCCKCRREYQEDRSSANTSRLSDLSEFKNGSTDTRSDDSQRSLQRSRKRSGSRSRSENITRKSSASRTKSSVRKNTDSSDCDGEKVKQRSKSTPRIKTSGISSPVDMGCCKSHINIGYYDKVLSDKCSLRKNGTNGQNGACDISDGSQNVIANNLGNLPELLNGTVSKIGRMKRTNV